MAPNQVLLFRTNVADCLEMPLDEDIYVVYQRMLMALFSFSFLYCNIKAQFMVLRRTHGVAYAETRTRRHRPTRTSTKM